MVSSAVSDDSVKRRTNWSTSGRPLTLQVAAWLWQNGSAACGQRAQCSIRQDNPGSGCLTAGGAANHVARSGRPARSHR